MGLRQRLFGFRWSLYIVHDGGLVYALHEKSVIRIAGYVMGFYANGGRPAPPWSLHLNSNHKHRSFELRPDHFTADGQNVTRQLLADIEAIDPGYRVKGGEPVFADMRTRKRIPLAERPDYSDMAAVLRRASEPKPRTFYSTMREVFHGEKASGV